MANFTPNFANYTNTIIIVLLILFGIEAIYCQNDSTNISTIDHHQPSEERSQFGGNYAFRGENCLMDHEQGWSGKVCVPLRNLTCQDNICECEPNTIYMDHPDIERCVVEPQAINDWTCEYDQPCQASSLGKYSRCNIGLRACECYDQGNKVIRDENICFAIKELGHSCENNRQCNMTIVGEAFCNGADVKSEQETNVSASANGICACSPGHIEDESKSPNECIALKSIGESCSVSLQCNDTSALGELARCSPDGKCECHDTSGFIIPKNTSYYVPNPNPNGERGTCYYVKGANDTCSSTPECILGFHPNAACLVHESWNGESVCQCTDGKKCDGTDDGNSAATTTRIIAIQLLLHASIMLIFMNRL